SAVEVRAEADRSAAIAFRRDVGPRALLHGKLSDPVGVIATISKQHLPAFQSRQKFSGKANVVGLTGAQRQPYRQTVAIDYRMDFARQAAAGPSHRLALVPCDAGSMLEVSIIWTAASWAAASASMMRPQTPARRHLTKRL